MPSRNSPASLCLEDIVWLEGEGGKSLYDVWDKVNSGVGSDYLALTSSKIARDRPSSSSQDYIL
jgi:hypothetical protein